MDLAVKVGEGHMCVYDADTLRATSIRQPHFFGIRHNQYTPQRFTILNHEIQEWMAENLRQRSKIRIYVATRRNSVADSYWVWFGCYRDWLLFSLRWT